MHGLENFLVVTSDGVGEGREREREIQTDRQRHRHRDTDRKILVKYFELNSCSRSGESG